MFDIKSYLLLNWKRLKLAYDVKKVLYAIFHSAAGIAAQVLVKRGKSITRKYKRDILLKKLKKSIN